MNVGLISRFPHWNKSMAPLRYYKGDDYHFEFLSPYRNQEDFIDPEGRAHPIICRSQYDTDVVLSAGSFTRDTHPLAFGKYPYQNSKYKLFVNHYLGYSVWDRTAVYDTINITDPDKLKGSVPVWILDKKFYDALVNTDWNSIEGYSDVAEFRENVMSEKKKILTTSDLLTYWSFPGEEDPLRIDAIGLALNWCNTKSDIDKTINRIVKLHEKFGKNICVHYHHYTSQKFKDRLNSYDWVDDVTDLTVTQFADLCQYYLVDETSMGYEISLRNGSHQIYYFDDLPGVHKEFRGVFYMGKIPKVFLSHLMDGNELVKSNYDTKTLIEVGRIHSSKDEVVNNFVKDIDLALNLAKNQI